MQSRKAFFQMIQARIHLYGLSSSRILQKVEQLCYVSMMDATIQWAEQMRFVSELEVQFLRICSFPEQRTDADF